MMLCVFESIAPLNFKYYQEKESARVRQGQSEVVSLSIAGVLLGLLVLNRVLVPPELLQDSEGLTSFYDTFFLSLNAKLMTQSYIGDRNLRPG